MSDSAQKGVESPAATDFLNTRSMLSTDEVSLQERVARFVDDRVIPRMSAAFDDHEFPRDLVPEIASLGLLGSGLDGYGCAGRSSVSVGIVYQELERGDSGVRSFASVQGGLCMYPIHAFGSDEQKSRWLPKLAAGEVIGCFGLTEASGGSDPSAMTTTARRDGDDWIIDGSKAWITNGTIADIGIIWATTSDGVRGFLVETGTAGYASRVITGKYSLRTSDTADLFFDGVRVPSAAMLPEARGLGGPLKCLTQARFGIAWGVIGAAQACLSEALAFSQERELFGRPLAHTQTVQRRLADMARRISTAQLLALQLARLKDEGQLHHSQVSMSKWNNTRMALDVARDARDLLGASGITVDCCAIRHMLNLESVVTYEGTETIHELIVGRELTGHNAF